MENLNPYSVTAKAQIETGVFGDHAKRTRGGFLYRKILVSHPVDAEILYSGWWFRQKIQFNGHVVWWQVSWLWIKKSAVFRLPAEVDPEQRMGRLEIDFGRGLRIRRFRLWIGEELIYDEIV